MCNKNLVKLRLKAAVAHDTIIEVRHILWGIRSLHHNDLSVQRAFILCEQAMNQMQFIRSQLQAHLGASTSEVKNAAKPDGNATGRTVLPGQKA